MRSLLGRSQTACFVGKHLMTFDFLPVDLVMEYCPLPGSRLRVVPVVAPQYLLLVADQMGSWAALP